MDISKKILSELTVHMKYAKYLPEVSRRETWKELVTRNMNMHIKKYPSLEGEIRENYKLVFDKNVLPSMRSLQFGGKPIEISPNRVYNCAYLPIDHTDAFSETMFLLLGGCFEENTEIITESGVKKICDVTINDKVLTYDITNKVYQYVHPFCVLQTPSENKDKFELEFNDGSIVKCTADHKFLTKNRGWIPAENLTFDDEIEDFKNQNAKFFEISEEDILKEYQPIFDLMKVIGNVH